MGKKTTTTKPAAPAKAAKPAAKAKGANGATPLTIEAAIAKPARATKPAAPKRTDAPKSAATSPALSQDDVALRAYFISEKRRAAGLPGDETQDWVEAERQLLAESKGRKKSSRA